MKTKNMVLTALFITLSLIGANLKIMGTIAFDSLPGFLGTLFLGPVYGSLIGAVGHFLTALMSGFPLTLPVHLVIMIIMATTMAVFGVIYRKFDSGQAFSRIGAILSGVAAVLINGPIGLIVLTPQLFPIIGKAGIIALLPVLSVVAAANIVLAFIIYSLLLTRIKLLQVEKHEH